MDDKFLRDKINDDNIEIPEIGRASCRERV